MYDSYEIEYIKKHGKITVRKIRFRLIIDLIIPVMMIGTALTVFFKFGLNDSTQLFASLGLLAFGALLLYSLIKKNQYDSVFVRVKTNQDAVHNLKWIQEHSEDMLNVHSGHIFEEDGLAIIRTKMSGFSWGEEVTFICLDHDLLINSSNTSTTFTRYFDKKNIQAIIKYMKENGVCIEAPIEY